MTIRAGTSRSTCGSSVVYCAARRSTSPVRGLGHPQCPRHGHPGPPSSAAVVGAVAADASYRRAIRRWSGAVMASAKAIESHIAPRLRAAAAEGGRPSPRIVAGLPVAVHDDEAEARAATAAMSTMYSGMTNINASSKPAEHPARSTWPSSGTRTRWRHSCESSSRRAQRTSGRNRSRSVRTVPGDPSRSGVRGRC